MPPPSPSFSELTTLGAELVASHSGDVISTVEFAKMCLSAARYTIVRYGGRNPTMSEIIPLAKSIRELLVDLGQVVVIITPDGTGNSSLEDEAPARSGTDRNTTH